MSKLDRNLHALAICYRILGGIAGLALTFFAILMLGTSSLSGGSFPIAGLVFVVPLLLIGGTLVFVVFEVASSLEHHERRTFCLVVAWLVCALFPLGTVLGVFTILQLMQPEAERVFSEAEVPHVKMEDFRNQAGSTAE
jgi:hypothetical protein